jgi:hypothetical protein
MSSALERLSRNQASCTASSVSPREPSMRQATARRRVRICSKRWAQIVHVTFLLRRSS